MNEHASHLNVAQGGIGMSRPVLYGAALLSPILVQLRMEWEPVLILLAWVAFAVIVSVAFRDRRR